MHEREQSAVLGSSYALGDGSGLFFCLVKEFAAILLLAGSHIVSKLYPEEGIVPFSCEQ